MFKHFFCSLVALVISASSVSAQVIRPQLSNLPDGSWPMGCGYFLDDWSGNILGRAPYGNSAEDRNVLLLAIDGEQRELPILRRSDMGLTAADAAYSVSVKIKSWKRVGSELSEARAFLKIKNNDTGAATNLIVKASEGC